MRIIGGKFKGIRFSPGKSFKARPTTDFARESLFNILNNRIDYEETSVLDLFSGTGSISYEFVSRGCPQVVSVEKESKHHRFILESLEKLDVKDVVTAIRGDVDRFLAKAKRSFDLVFADPPYDMKTLETLPERIFNSGAVKEGTLVIVEHGKQNDFSAHPYFFELRQYGSVHFSMFVKE